MPAWHLDECIDRVESQPQNRSGLIILGDEFRLHPPLEFYSNLFKPLVGKSNYDEKEANKRPKNWMDIDHCFWNIMSLLR